MFAEEVVGEVAFALLVGREGTQQVIDVVEAELLCGSQLAERFRDLGPIELVTPRQYADELTKHDVGDVATLIVVVEAIYDGFGALRLRRIVANQEPNEKVGIERDHVDFGVSKDSATEAATSEFMSSTVIGAP